MKAALTLKSPPSPLLCSCKEVVIPAPSRMVKLLVLISTVPAFPLPKVTAAIPVAVDVRSKTCPGCRGSKLIAPG